MNDFTRILDKYRKISFSQKDKGERFERLMQGYLQTEPIYASKFKKVWLWNEFPGKNDLGGTDTGIDLVALTNDGDYWAIQCKCFQEGSTIDKPAVDSFLATSSRKFKDENLKTIQFSHRLWISTTNRWGANAEEAIKNQHPPVSRISLYDLQVAPIDWEKLENDIHGEKARIAGRDLRAHQKTALDLTEAHLTNNDRGKLIMACGTGKTFTALRIAENQTNNNGLVLFLVPSIALLGQTLREWSTFAVKPINAICICSDPEISKTKKQNEDKDTTKTIDLALPASTNTAEILNQFQHHSKQGNEGMTVVFSTYQSIAVIAAAQKELIKNGYPEFDLIICDEAHRTTGVSLAGEDESAFTKVHDNSFIQAKKRIYMTATPRLYDLETKSKAAQAEAILCSMDDESLYGKEIYRIGFGEAVEKDLLTDYKVLILTLNDKDVPPAVQKMIMDKESEINTDDASKLIGCINALSKQFLGEMGILEKSDPNPMKKAVAFCQSIATSKKITATFNVTTDAYIDSLPTSKKKKMVSVTSKHIDGSMSAPERDELLGWLKTDGDDNECRILTNVRCLSEGVDVPSLDAVLFLSARNSQVDVVQSVGRVMRKAPGKKYGYIIIPVVVPSDVEADKALDDNERYKVVWTVLNALRAHDDRFNAIVNKIELNKNKPQQILVGRPDFSFDGDGNPLQWNDDNDIYQTANDINQQMSLQFEQLQNVVFARMVEKVGDRRYWEQWAKNVAEIAERQVTRINRLIEEDQTHEKTFENFLKGLQKNINPSITKQQAVDMLSQHIITKPVFEALFDGYSFVKNNPISISMQSMLDLLEDQSFDKDAETLQKFYDSVKMRASGIDNAEGKQRIIIELYDKFFKTAFPKMVEQLGIVYTPVEVVDFIIHSVNDILKKEFERSLTDENVHILDPFTGTGTFITRLLQSGLIAEKDLERKYLHELHANEIVLLAYYIATINIENAYHDATPDPDDGIGKEKYQPFDGIVLTDTFQLGETDASEQLFSEMFPQNSERVAKQKKAPLRVIIGNPPYSIGQKNANDNAQNQSYPNLDAKIASSYAKLSSAGLNKSLYDAYIKAFRWSTDRLDENGGVIAFITNGAWLDGNSTDGFRKSIENEFSSIYVFNLRGNARTSGELRQKEAGNVFGSGSRTPISITLLIKNPDVKTEKATIHYHEIGDYLSREQKLDIVSQFKSGGHDTFPWKQLIPNEHGDWISQRNDAFENYFQLAPSKTYDTKSHSFFVPQSLGVLTARDAWVYNFSKKELIDNINKTISHYNEQRNLIITKQISDPITDSTKGSWSQIWIDLVNKNYEIKDDSKEYRISEYRPFIKSNLYFGKDLIARRYQLPKIFPNSAKNKNLAIVTTGAGAGKPFSTLIVNNIPNYDFIEKSNCFPLYYYEENISAQKGLFDEGNEGDYIRRDGVSDFILERAKKQYGKNVTKEDIFYYVYGFLHSPEYRETFANDLKKMLPRLPLVEDVRDFWAFSKAGRTLAELHLNYESIPAYEGVTIQSPDVIYQMSPYEMYEVTKMRFPKKDQKDTIIYNGNFIITNIPAKAYEYVVNGKSAIEWIMERYQVTVHKDSGIKNNPNDWALEHDNPSYIYDLLLSIINVSVQTVEIVEGLPKVRFE
ncbi:DEAD/DEAH box helicase [Flavobacterium stagni]|uniref:Helicase n=1 Tax=Flavobacterium stagni TaxID=2506421 RepID=A0A4Q1K6K7_9FLAO|nr:type ISP restriction/modification enzyme [Flavobacterium stagni]RXR20189.1 helicase [Flavobacterium stagni]